MNLSFTLEQMIDSLTKIGYVVIEEKVSVSKPMVGNSNNEEPVKVWNVYLHDQLMCEWGSHGTYRVEFVFKQELEKRLLNLF